MCAAATTERDGRAPPVAERGEWADDVRAPLLATRALGAINAGSATTPGMCA
jgi:hypothetical protein